DHNSLGHFVFGAGLTGPLSALRLRFASWPLQPVGFLLLYTMPIQRIWFSIFLGWLAKMLLVRFGGSTIYRAARPYFIGMIIGEAAAAATWLIVAMIRNAQGLPFESINLLPS